jgi:hypothetical protein
MEYSLDFLIKHSGRKIAAQYRWQRRLREFPRKAFHLLGHVLVIGCYLAIPATIGIAMYIAFS